MDIGCSYCPVAVDVSGVIRLSNALSIVEERLANIICIGKSDRTTISIIPDHMNWVVTLWHFGRDRRGTYAGEKFYVSWEVAEHALVIAYSKDWKDGKRKIRLEKQEYPKKTLAEALEEKLNANIGGG